MQPVSGQAKMWALACPNQNLWHLWGLILELEFRIHLILGGGRSFSPIKLFLFPVAQPVKNLQWGRPGFDLWVWKTPWRRAWQPTPVFFPGESHGRRSLVGYSPWGHKEWNTTEWHFHFSLFSFLLSRGFCHWETAWHSALRPLWGEFSLVACPEWRQQWGMYSGF